MDDDKLSTRVIVGALASIQLGILLAMLIGPLIPHVNNDKIIEALTHAFDEINGAFVAIMSTRLMGKKSG